MNKSFVIFLILFLVLFTALIKNSTKRIDDQIFVIKENITVLEKKYGDIKFEYTYLSSGKKLMDLKDKYFEKEFKAKKKNEIEKKEKKLKEFNVKKIEK